MEMHQILLFPRALRGTELHQGSRTLQCGAAFAHPRYQAAGGRVRRSSGQSREGEHELSQLGRMMRLHLAEVMQLEIGAQRSRETGEEPPHHAAAGRDVHDRAGAASHPGRQSRRCHPDLDLEVIDSTARELEDRLKRDELEVAIYCRPDHPDDRLHYLKLFRERMMIVLAPTHHLAKHDPIRFQDLHNERYLNRINCEFNEGLAWEKYGVSWKAVYRSERDDWILAMCAAGMGFGFLPEFCINHQGVVARPVVDPEFWREVNVVTVRGRPHSPAVGALVREAMRTNWTGQNAIA